MEFMEFIIFTHGVFLGALIMWMFKSGQEDKYEARIQSIGSELVRFKEKEIQNNILKQNYRRIEKYMRKFHPEALRK